MAAPRESNVELGFVEKVPKERLYSRFFPSKVGGKPAWLDLKCLPKSEDLACKNCGKPCIFLLQIYAPISERDSCFHRTLFIFLCKDTLCHKNNLSFIVLRSQLPRANDFYEYEPPDENEDNTEDHPNPEDFGCCLCRVCGCLGGKRCSKCHKASYCGKEHQTIDWKKGHHKKDCGDDADHRFLFPEFELVTEPEEDHSDEESDDEKYSKYLKDADAGSDGVQNLKIEELQKMAVTETKEDKVFLAFKKRVAMDPEQVLRHQRGGQPLWISNTHRPKPDDIPPCSCGASRQFEFQVMPQLLIHLNIDQVGASIDWGTLLIYTCSASCDEGPAYHSEILWKQDVEDKQQDS